jgi:hypothetical protein
VKPVMHIRKKQIIEIPKLKMSKIRGVIGYRFLEIIDEKPFRKVSEVRKEFKPIVIADKQLRAKGSPKLWRSLQKLLSTPKSEEKLFDTEYCAVRDFLEAFDFVAPLGPRADEQITLTYFGSMLLKLCRKNNASNIFDDSIRDFRARVYLFIDNIRRWNFIQIIRKKGPITFEAFSALLFQLGIGLDTEKIKRDIAAKPDFRRRLAEEWKKKHILAPIDYRWKEKMIERYSEARAREDAYVRALLNLYIDSGLIRKEGDLLYPNTSYISQLHEQRFWVTSEEIDHAAFFRDVYEVYKQLLKKRGVMSVPIPELRRAACLRLNMPWNSFDRLLCKYPTGLEIYEIALTRGSSVKRLDLSINSKHFYYIQFKKTKGDN